MSLLDISEEMQEYADIKARKEEEEGNQNLDTRTIRYNFGPDFLELENMELNLEFYLKKDEPIKKLLFIEKHFLQGQVLRSFEFEFDSCKPKEKNVWNLVYSFGELSAEAKTKMTNIPWQVSSDSFFFADGQLIVHNKAIYNYCTK